MEFEPVFCVYFNSRKRKLNHKHTIKYLPKDFKVVREGLSSCIGY